MANTLAPFGFLQYYGGAGGAPTFAQTTRRIASSYTTAIYTGDVVSPVANTPTGYIQLGNATDIAAKTNGQTVAGIFVGCRYLSTSQKRVVWSNYWPGSDATGDVDAYVIDDPNARFLVQSSWSTPLMTSTSTYGTSPVGQYCNYTVGTGNANTGRSGAYVSSLLSTSGFPFVVVDVQAFPPGTNGTDITSQYYNVVVGFNNEWLRNNGQVTGIS
jgi:hypothetical protein